MIYKKTQQFSKASELYHSLKGTNIGIDKESTSDNLFGILILPTSDNRYLIQDWLENLLFLLTEQTRNLQPIHRPLMQGVMKGGRIDSFWVHD
jgi:hypothetical protein